MAKLKFQHHYSVFGVTQSFRNHSNMPICCSRNINVENKHYKVFSVTFNASLCVLMHVCFLLVYLKGIYTNPPCVGISHSLACGFKYSNAEK